MKDKYGYNIDFTNHIAPVSHVCVNITLIHTLLKCEDPMANDRVFIDII